MIVVVKEDEDGKITLTKEELEKLLEDARKEGQQCKDRSYEPQKFYYTSEPYEKVPYWMNPEFKCCSAPTCTTTCSEYCINKVN